MIIDMPPADACEGPVCPHCGHRLKAVCRVLAGEIEFDFMGTTEFKGNYPDWFTGVIVLDRVVCSMCHDRRHDIEPTLAPTTRDVKTL